MVARAIDRNGGVRRNRPGPIADDGSALRFCSTCAFSEACLAQGYDKVALAIARIMAG